MWFFQVGTWQWNLNEVIKWALPPCRVPPWNRPAPPAHYTSTTTCLERVCCKIKRSCSLCMWVYFCITPHTVTDIEELNVVLKERSRTTTLLWLSGSHGDFWHHGEVTVGRLPQDFVILFEGSRAFNKPGHIAIDDVDFTNCTLPGSVPALPAHSNMQEKKVDSHSLN